MKYTLGNELLKLVTRCQRQDVEIRFYGSSAYVAECLKYQFSLRTKANCNGILLYKKTHYKLEIFQSHVDDLNAYATTVAAY